MTVLLEMKNNIVSVSWNKTNVVLNCHIYRATNKNGKCVFWIRIANIRLTQVHVTWDKTTNYSQMDYPSQNEYSRG